DPRLLSAGNLRAEADSRSHDARSRPQTRNLTLRRRVQGNSIRALATVPPPWEGPMKIAKLSAVLALLAAALSAPSTASASTVTISPIAGTATAMPQTQISFLGAPASTLGPISVVGSQSARHAG